MRAAAIRQVASARRDAAVDTNKSRSPIRVLLWSTRGAGLHYGGPGMSAYRLYAKDDGNRFAIGLVHASRTQARYDLFGEIAAIRPQPAGPLSLAQFLLNSKAWLKQNAGRYDVFHGLRGFHETVLPARQARRLGLPAVVKIATHRADLADKRGWRSVLDLPRRRREILKELDGVIAISRPIAEELLGYGIPERKIARIPNGVDVDQFRPAVDGERRELRAALGWRDLPTILFTGAVLPRKRPHLILEAAGLARKRGYECQLVLAGPNTHDADYVAALRRRAAELGCGDLLFMPGFVADVAPLYRAADLFSLPSEQEGMPNALLEAAASGLPAIVTGFPGVNDVIADGSHGLIVEPESEAIAKAIVAYVASPSLAAEHGAAGRKQAVTKFSTRVVLHAHERLFRRIIAGDDAAC